MHRLGIGKKLLGSLINLQTTKQTDRHAWWLNVNKIPLPEIGQVGGHLSAQLPISHQLHGQDLGRIP